MPEEKEDPKNHEPTDFYEDVVIPANEAERRKKTADELRAKRAEFRKKPLQNEDNPSEEKPPKDDKK